MAADLIMPTLPSHQVHSQYFVPSHAERPHLSHNRSQSYYQPRPQYSQQQQQQQQQHQQQQQQQDSPLSSANGSPTSPGGGRLNGSRQNRLLFMPAVLRPSTDFASTLPKSPASETGPDGDDLTLRRVSSSFISLPGLTAFGSRLARRTTGDSGKGFVDSDLDPELFPEVNGHPTRKHWKPDTQSAVCDHPTCKRTFSYFVRRHHCRKCGNIFCDAHSAHAVPLDQDCKYNPRGAVTRSCDHCFSEFVSWKSSNTSQASSDQGSLVEAAIGARNAGPNTLPSSPVSTGSSPINGSTNMGQATQARGPEVAASVPRDWNWSTF